MPAVIILIVLIAADQLLKWWTVSHLALGESAPLIPGVIQLTRLHNTGAAWSSFSGETALLTAVTLVLMAAVAVLLVKKIVRHRLGVAACLLILGGGLGNMIDRVARGYVVDMFDLQLFRLLRRGRCDPRRGVLPLPLREIRREKEGERP